jgi:hypothetical protein
MTTVARSIGYFDARAPLVGPDQSNAGAGSTFKKRESGYFPDADSPFVPRNTSGVQ